MEKLKNFWDKKLFRQILYFLFVILTIFFLNFLGDKVFDIDKLLESYEWKTYDLRIKTYYNLNKDKPNKVKKVNPNIVIVSIDNASLDVLESDLGRWPWTRDVWTDTINYLTNDGVDILNFDMMFVGYQKGFENKDIELAKTIADHDNVYASMSLDYRDEAQNAPELPPALKTNLENRSKTINFENFDFNYCNLILDRIINGTKNVGIINFMRDDDSVSRRSPTFFKYKDNYYAYMPLKLTIFQNMKKLIPINMQLTKKTSFYSATGKFSLIKKAL